MLRALLHSGPVVWLSHVGMYGVVGFDEVREVLTDFETYCSGGGLGPTDIRFEDSWREPGILESDPPSHTLLRRVLTGVINPSTVRALRDQFSGPADAVAREFGGRDRIDAIADIAELYPLRVFPDDGRDTLVPHGSMAFNALGPKNEIWRRALSAG